MNKNEKIIGSKAVLAKGREMVIVTTESNETVWVTKQQFAPKATTITYKPRKAGEAYTNSEGAQAVLKADRNDFVGLDKVSVMENSTKETIDYLLSKGVTPSFNL